jgi:hypothetical protein
VPRLNRKRHNGSAELPRRDHEKGLIANDRLRESGNAEGGSMYRILFRAWLAVMAIFAADVIYRGWGLVAVAAGFR